MRSATPATILVLAACILLVLVTCSTPVIKSLAFLEATIGGNGNESGQKATLGCLGYCIEGTCKGPTIGYSFDPTQLLGIATNVEGYSVNSSKYSTAVIKGLTYCLVLNPIALAACVITLLTGLLAHCGDMSLVCINGLFSGLASTLTLIAVALNFALFVLAKKRIDSINGASASYGTALWLALAAWILIVLSSCAFCCGCGGRGGGGGRNKRNKMQDEDTWKAPQNTGSGAGGVYGANNGYADQMRMDAIQAESDRKRRQKDLPKFATYETEHVEELPLKQDYEDYTPHNQGRHGGLPPGAGYHGGGQYQQDYGYAYGDDNSYAMHNAAGTGAGSNAYIAGVGTGALRGPQPQAAAGRYYDSSVPNSSNNLAGYGAHDLSSPATTVPPHVNGYGSNTGTPLGMPEPVHANSTRGDGNMDYFYDANPSANHPVTESEGLQSHDVYGGYMNDTRSQQNHQYEQSSGYPYEASYQSHQDLAPASGHGTDVEGGTFGPQSRSTKQSQYAHSSQHDHSYNGGANGTRSRSQSQSRHGATAESSQSPYDAVQQATAAGRSRRLPAIPTGAAISSNHQQSAGEIPYSPTSPSQQQMQQMNEGFGANSVPSPRQTTGDDGFGLAVLKAGAAAAASSSHHHSDLPPPGYSEEQQPSSSSYHNPYSYPSEKR